MNSDKKYRFLDLSGYGFSGKHAVIDLVREFKGYHVPHFEFNLIRIQGGIRDLENAKRQLNRKVVKEPDFLLH